MVGMNKNLIFGVIIVAILAATVAIIMNNSAKSAAERDEMMKKEATLQEVTVVQNEDVMMKKTTRYVDYSQVAFDNAKDQKRVYFFHAAWCPTCRIANEEFMSNIDQIPEGLVLFKTDYDTEKELKTRYGITSQHTFVLVDSSGEEIKKWNGGGVKELVENTL